MPGFTVQRSGFAYVPDLIYAVVEDLLAHGFTRVFPSSPLTTPVANTPYAPFKITLASSPSTDPLALTQPWSIQFNASGPQLCDVFVATPLQLPIDGSVAQAANIDGSSTSTPLFAGQINSTGSNKIAGATAVVAAIDPDALEHFIQRTGRLAVVGTPQNYPMSYRISITSHGFALFVWEDASDATGTMFSWITVQRPVNRTTGAPLTQGRCPMFCVFGNNGLGNVSNPAYTQAQTDYDAYLALKAAYDARNVERNDWAAAHGGSYTGAPAALPNPVVVTAPASRVPPIPATILGPVSAVYKFVVREVDVEKPTLPADATASNADSNAIINSKQQVAITEANQYVITFPNGLNTQRYAYTEELDLIAYTSADVVSAHSEVALTVYGEATPRTYKAMSANGVNNTGMRILMLTAGGPLL